ncbi:MAG: RNA polymerase sigma factor, partial [Actinomycetota bacterium]
DAFVRVVGRLHHLRDQNAFDAYLRRAVVNLAKNYFRHRATERAFLHRTRVPEETAGPEARLVERHAAIAALGKLSSRQRAAIVLRFYEDLPEATVADILRCRRGTVRSLVTRGVQTLRVELERNPDA